MFNYNLTYCSKAEPTTASAKVGHVLELTRSSPNLTNLTCTFFLYLY